jgi:hypothetical protein
MWFHTAYPEAVTPSIKMNPYIAAETCGLKGERAVCVYDTALHA